MTLVDFKASLKEDSPPIDLNRAQEALWYAGKGDWETAHNICQESDQELDWVHAWLHRQEGDLSNAGYWYRRAGQTMSPNSLEKEWDEIAEVLTARRG